VVVRRSKTPEGGRFAAGLLGAAVESARADSAARKTPEGGRFAAAGSAEGNRGSQRGEAALSRLSCVALRERGRAPQALHDPPAEGEGEHREREDGEHEIRLHAHKTAGRARVFPVSSASLTLKG